MPWVNDKLTVWRPAQWKPINFTMQLSRASYDNILRPHNTQDVIDADVAFCEGVNPTSIRIDMGFDAFAENNTAAIAKLDKAIATIKAHKRKLIIADAAREYYRHHKPPWDQFAQEWEERIRTLAQRYQPDYYIVIKEPGWYNPMIRNLLLNPTMWKTTTWVNLLDSLNKAVKRVSPNTKTGIAMPGSNLVQNYLLPNEAMMVQALTLPSNDIIAFDLYGQHDYACVEDFLNRYGNGGKEVWLAELWSGGNNVCFDASRTELDRRWVVAAYDFALHENASAMSMFFTDAMCDYDIHKTTDPSTLVSLYQTHRLPSYTAYQALIAGQLPTFDQ